MFNSVGFAMVVTIIIDGLSINALGVCRGGQKREKRKKITYTPLNVASRINIVAPCGKPLKHCFFDPPLLTGRDYN